MRSPPASHIDSSAGASASRLPKNGTLASLHLAAFLNILLEILPLRCPSISFQNVLCRMLAEVTAQRALDRRVIFLISPPLSSSFFCRILDGLTVIVIFYFIFVCSSSLLEFCLKEPDRCV
jgi:hypothetical protein